MRPIRVAVVDDSSFVRRAIRRLLREESRIRVVGTAATGEELLAHLRSWRPDVITLDLAMPGMGGLATVDRLQETRPTPVIILSTHSGRGAPQTIEALHRGAVDFIDKQRYSLMDFDALRRVLVEKIVQVHEGAGSQASSAPSGGPPRVGKSAPQRSYRLVLIGASTGGPPAIQTLLEAWAGPLPVPAVIAQHMPEGFTRAFANRLNTHLPFPVREATHKEHLLPGTAYVAPAGRHLLIQRDDTRDVPEDDRGEALRAAVVRGEGRLYSPSVDWLFESACQAVGGDAVAVLLSGMGRDGARGMLALRTAGALTVAQDEASCVVYGMPAAAVALDAATVVLPLDRIGPRLREELLGPETGSERRKRVAPEAPRPRTPRSSDSDEEPPGGSTS